MMLPKPSGISPTPLKSMLGCGITSADTKYPKERQTPTLWKQTMRNYVTTWRVWLGNRAAFLAVPMPSNVPCDYLSIASIVVNCINSASLITLPMSEISFHHLFSHSRQDRLCRLSQGASCAKALGYRHRGLAVRLVYPRVHF